jgi:hypothetical protein
MTMIAMTSGIRTRLVAVVAVGFVGALAACSGDIQIGDGNSPDGGGAPDGKGKSSATSPYCGNGPAQYCIGVAADGGVDYDASTVSIGVAPTADAGGTTTIELDATTIGPEDAGPAEVPDATCPGTGTNGVTVPASSLQGYAVPSGTYTSALDSNNQLNGAPTMLLASTASANSNAFGTASAFNYVPESAIGKRYRVSAQMKTNNAQAASLWFSVNTETEQTLANGLQPEFVALIGTNDWQTVEQVLDVPSGAIGFDFGSLLSGTGEVWVGPITLEEVSSCIPVSGSEMYPISNDAGSSEPVDASITTTADAQ